MISEIPELPGRKAICPTCHVEGIAYMDRGRVLVLHEGRGAPCRVADSSPHAAVITSVLTPKAKVIGHG